MQTKWTYRQKATSVSIYMSNVGINNPLLLTHLREHNTHSDHTEQGGAMESAQGADVRGVRCLARGHIDIGIGRFHRSSWTWTDAGLVHPPDKVCPWPPTSDLPVCPFFLTSPAPLPKVTSRTGFEPVRGNPIGFRVQRLNLSATVTAYTCYPFRNYLFSLIPFLGPLPTMSGLLS